MKPLVLKRIYEPASADDGTRILVDRLWPRGIAKDKAQIDIWLKDIAPSDALRKDFHGKPDEWDAFLFGLCCRARRKARPCCREVVVRSAETRTGYPTLRGAQ